MPIACFMCRNDANNNNKLHIIKRFKIFVTSIAQSRSLVWSGPKPEPDLHGTLDDLSRGHTLWPATRSHNLWPSQARHDDVVKTARLCDFATLRLGLEWSRCRSLQSLIIALFYMVYGISVAVSFGCPAIAKFIAIAIAFAV